MKIESKISGSHKTGVKVSVAFIAIVLIILGSGIIGPLKFNVIAILFGILLFMSVFFEKKAYVKEEGLLVTFDAKIVKKDELWKWHELYSITYEGSRRTKNATTLYFTKDDRTRNFEFSQSDAGRIINLAKDYNPNMKIYNGNKYRK